MTTLTTSLTTEGIRLGRNRYTVRLIQTRRVIQLKDYIYGHSAEIPLDALLGGLSIARIHDLIDPILKAAHEAEVQSERKLKAAQRRRIRERDDHKCRYCGGTGTPRFGPDGQSWHIDHVAPRVSGGLDEDDNLVLACATCNLAKHGRDLDDFEEEAQDRATVLRLVEGAR